MNKAEVKIWERVFNLDVGLQMYPGVEVALSQKATINSICSIDFEQSLDAVKVYVATRNGAELNETGIRNIFKYVMPDHFYVPRRPDGMLALMCNYRFDPEHGIAVVYIDGRFKKVCTQDEVL